MPSGVWVSGNGSCIRFDTFHSYVPPASAHFVVSILTFIAQATAIWIKVEKNEKWIENLCQQKYMEKLSSKYLSSFINR